MYEQYLFSLNEMYYGKHPYFKALENLFDQFRDLLKEHSILQKDYMKELRKDMRDFLSDRKKELDDARFDKKPTTIVEKLKELLKMLYVNCSHFRSDYASLKSESFPYYGRATYPAFHRHYNSI